MNKPTDIKQNESNAITFERGSVTLLLSIMLFVSSLIGIFLSGWAITILWRWFFVEPTGFVLSLKTAIGASFLLSFRGVIPSEKTTNKQLLLLIIFKIVNPFVLLMFAWFTLIFFR